MNNHPRQDPPFLRSGSSHDLSLFFSSPLTSPLIPFALWPSPSRRSFLHALQSHIRSSPSHPAHSPRLRFRSWRALSVSHNTYPSPQLTPHALAVALLDKSLSSLPPHQLVLLRLSLSFSSQLFARDLTSGLSYFASLSNIFSAWLSLSVPSTPPSPPLCPPSRWLPPLPLLWHRRPRSQPPQNFPTPPPPSSPLRPPILVNCALERAVPREHLLRPLLR